MSNPWVTVPNNTGTTISQSTPEPDTYVTELARKLKFIYKAAGNDDMVSIPRQLLADTLVALLEDELVERRRADVAREIAEKAEAQRQYMEQLAMNQSATLSRMPKRGWIE